MKEIDKEHSLKLSRTEERSKETILKFRRPSKLADKLAS